MKELNQNGYGETIYSNTRRPRRVWRRPVGWVGIFLFIGIIIYYNTDIFPKAPSNTASPTIHQYLLKSRGMEKMQKEAYDMSLSVLQRQNPSSQAEIQQKITELDNEMKTIITTEPKLQALQDIYEQELALAQQVLQFVSIHYNDTYTKNISDQYNTFIDESNKLHKQERQEIVQIFEMNHVKYQVLPDGTIEYSYMGF